jgi:diadenosine tetraphosphate (Ap4A) HIT family hydrolase
MSHLTPPEITDLFMLAQFVQKVLEDMHGVMSSTLSIQDGQDAGQTVKVWQHFHFSS